MKVDDKGNLSHSKQSLYFRKNGGRRQRPADEEDGDYDDHDAPAGYRESTVSLAREGVVTGGRSDGAGDGDSGSINLYYSLVFCHTPLKHRKQDECSQDFIQGNTLEIHRKNGGRRQRPADEEDGDYDNHDVLAGYRESGPDEEHNITAAQVCLTPHCQRKDAAGTDCPSDAANRSYISVESGVAALMRGKRRQRHLQMPAEGTRERMPVC
ncbi:hypothetical protein ROHU_027463 [Labeo rohita]|uniref:Uncharacterized protein n=1 Tax=Labeo rohita TaxID=84645 RepID=A0A498MB34_LABRO|nr:hypothetical protein ROHU_027463 [Labeo rohita]